MLLIFKHNELYVVLYVYHTSIIYITHPSQIIFCAVFIHPFYLSALNWVIPSTTSRDLYSMLFFKLSFI